MKSNRKSRGFTLIEILVVVVIIGILAAVALPQYQKAVYKSRYSAMMPLGKKLSEGNEAYYMEHGAYSLDPTQLDIAGMNEKYPDGTEISLGDDADVSYVLAAKDSVPNAKYVVYQKHSTNFPDNVHCEALDTDEKATWLCRDALKGEPVTQGERKSLSGADYTAYVLSGNAEGSTFNKSCSGSAPTQEGETCPSGCGKMTATGSCDPWTGEWNEPEFDENSCPSPLPDETKACENGSGMMVRHSQCKADGSGYEYGAWDESACCEGEKPTTAFSKGSLRGIGNYGTSYSGSVSAGDWECRNGQWQYGSFNSTLQLSGINISCTDFNTFKPSAPNGGSCTGTYLNGALCDGTYSYGCSNSTFTGGSNISVCQVSNRYPDKAAYACGYSTFNNKSICHAYAKDGCYGSTFNEGAACFGHTAGGCNGAIIKAGAYCKGSAAGGCAGAIFEEGSCCKGTCPAGAPICS